MSEGERVGSRLQSAVADYLSRHGYRCATNLSLRIERDGRLVGAINWFATHGTSMTNRNMLISGDNKGYAAYHWEHRAPGMVGAAHLSFPGLGHIRAEGSGYAFEPLNYSALRN